MITQETLRYCPACGSYWIKDDDCPKYYGGADGDEAARRAIRDGLCLDSVPSEKCGYAD